MGRAIRMEESRNVYKILIWKSEEVILPDTTLEADAWNLVRHRCEGIIKIVFGEMVLQACKLNSTESGGGGGGECL